MKKKNIVIISIIFIILLGTTVTLALVQKKNKRVDSDGIEEYYEIVESSGAMFKGASVISDEHRIFLDNSLKVEKLHIKDKDEIKKGDLILTYLNEAIKEEIDGLQLQYDLTNDKLNRAKENKNKNKSNIASKEAVVKNKKRELNSLNEADLNKQSQLELEVTEVQQELEMMKSNNEAEDVNIDSLKDSQKEFSQQINILKNKLKKNIKSDIDGIAYINEEGLVDPSIPYIIIVSKDPLVKGIATEYDILDLSIEQELNIRVISTEDEMKGIITSIDDLPSASEDGKGVVYHFNVKPEKEIRIGFSVEIRESIDTFEVPKDYVSKEDKKLIVGRMTDNELEKIEVKGKLDSDYYIIKKGNLNLGDKLVVNPLEQLEIEETDTDKSEIEESEEE